MAQITLDTMVDLPGSRRRETVFRHLENGDLRMLMVTGYSTTGQGKGRTAYVADLVAAPGLHWELAKESALTYVTRRLGGQVTAVAYDDWCTSVDKV